MQSAELDFIKHQIKTITIAIQTNAVPSGFEMVDSVTVATVADWAIIGILSDWLPPEGWFTVVTTAAGGVWASVEDGALGVVEAVLVPFL